MDIEQVKKAETPEKMRAELSRLRRYDPLVSNIMNMADFNGLSGEDRYTFIAYYAMSERNRFQQLILNQTMVSVQQPIVVVSKNESPPPSGEIKQD